ncbi:ureidoglycolate lyase [Saccharicrinis aurantiacus]|uniref:ureidoglycolate lyase n=1 Tax=Saccharicrinis aurantiacus TaxID=1849719 RepID=UPI00094FF11A|nr:ureidoglycolate lyase [Saccharicrinis aurantiacus]
MREVKVEQLTLEAYKPFGTYANLINPTDEKLGAAPVEFFRDQLQIEVDGNNSWSYSCCRVQKRENVIDILEFHTGCGEVVLPLDQDILLQVAPATASENDIPLDKMRVFYVPKGTAITIKAGVWHWGPFATEDTPANILINLPERTYANDCVVKELAKEDHIKIIK